MTLFSDTFLRDIGLGDSKGAHVTSLLVLSVCIYSNMFLSYNSYGDD